MAEPQRIVIIGSGLAGASAAGSLREQGYDNELILFGREAHQPYELPALSKDVLLGNTDEPNRVHEADFYEAHRVDLRLGTEITEIRASERAIVDSDGVTHSYDRLVLATGSTPRTLPVPNADLPGLRTLRTIEDSLSLRESLTADARVVIVGAGWIGCEVAAAARRHGSDVTVVDPVDLPLRRVLGPTIGAVFRDLHADHGVHWRLGIGVDGFTPNGVRLADGSEVRGDVVVLGVGAKPNTDLAEKAGLTLAEGGVAVDAALRTSSPDICAIGDIAAHDHPRYGRRVRVEHWANAKDQGAHVAGTILGRSEAYTGAPYFFSDQYDLGMEYRGLADAEHDRLVVRGSLEDRDFTAFWLRDGRLRAAMNVNQWDDGVALQALVDSHAAVSPDQLRTATLADLV
ncbi:NADPH-dependent 2,4-dienoyl-CoA reductase/sulfur reductase-like enzyme [Saccharothrix tamanrassetensis]|uniref:NADPH-dependent 2,4-dienoyl-CoA reductase/sulfur reductase-like enzyme n=1 Tax=Saccharothrix tamanrassetensis TaxID=1051531 RepID=A0A841CKY9_9PSEU|nr:FAD-dependent oxidoreductase [Saccharothrix tamanrassetensis]MBB5957603.1 NADPH-dependent 2,4-dienoyl-CoA reductase/sulfur reductase-like enzyme [Saccharothrix tamanrassetensis]